MRSFGFSAVSLEQITHIVGQYDTDAKGGWDTVQFVSYLFHHLIVLNGMNASGHHHPSHGVTLPINDTSHSRRKSKHLQLLDEIFECYDTTGKNYISRSDIAQILSIVNEPVNDTILSEMMDNKDRISRGEFYELMRGEIDEGLLDGLGEDDAYDENAHSNVADSSVDGAEDPWREDIANESLMRNSASADETFEETLKNAANRRREDEEGNIEDDDPFEEDLYEDFDEEM
eukprot:CAMPEP_0117444000 /NCGR_PEP_ID=MMETSP0759-20121206/5002_1 /TAXON_ID=63605 /ORGANISM="Percolomonas cosmopolitus, Strain WS" /LENGTH=230 /DNA_ID=CAMNT_0005236027 /DNA_START=102 /DNA_END=794 /DNA_ORIENTATION=+